MEFPEWLDSQDTLKRTSNSSGKTRRERFLRYPPTPSTPTTNSPPAASAMPPTSRPNPHSPTKSASRTNPTPRPGSADHRHRHARSERRSEHIRADRDQFANQTIAIPPGLDSYNAMVPMTTPTGASIVVNVQASLDRSTRTLSLVLQALDPATGWYSEDPLVGLLYPEDGTDRGVGSISYLVKPRPDLPSGTVIQNQAKIVFDYNDPINTPLVKNTLDAATPTSQVAPLPATTTTTTFTVSWSGQDEASGSGIAGYDVYVSVDGGSYFPLVSDTTKTSMPFTA